MIMRDFLVKIARNGKGIFTRKTFPVNERVFEIKGNRVTRYEDEVIDEIICVNAIRFSMQYYLSPEGEVANYLNHSCEPNTKIMKKKKLYLVAISNIAKDIELVFDYSTITAQDDNWTTDCNCGIYDCRRVVQKFSKLPVKL